MEMFRALLTPVKIVASWLLATAIFASILAGPASRAAPHQPLPVLQAPAVEILVSPIK